MANVVEFRIATREAGELPCEGFAPSSDADTVYWIHVDEGEREALVGLAAALGLDAEELEYLTEEASISGLVERDAAVQLTLHVQDADGSGVERRLRLHLTERCCVAVTSGRVGAVETFEASYRREVRFARSSNFMLFLVLDALVDRFAYTVSRVDDECEKLGDQIYAEPSKECVTSILRLKRKVIELKRQLAHAREVLMRLSGRRMVVVNDATREALHEVSGHAQALLASAESLRELVSSYMDATMSIQAQRMNETMKVLTLFASILLPMTLFAGIWGMNFKGMPELDEPWGYPLALGVIAACGLGTFLWFRRRGLI